MKSLQIICAAACAISSAYAAPNPSRTSNRIVSRQPIAKRDVENSNWSGPFVNSDGVSQVSAAISVPTITVPDGATATQYFGGAWVGIDNADTSGALWQAGVNWEIDNTVSPPSVSYTVFTEWLPGPPVTVDGVTVGAGDTLTVTLSLSDSTTGSVDLSSSSGGSATVAGNAPSDTDTVDGSLALWIVEDVGGSTLAPFANYGSLSFTGCSFESSSGGGDASGGDTYVFGGSSCTTSGSEVDCSYQG